MDTTVTQGAISLQRGLKKAQSPSPVNKAIKMQLC